MTIQNNARVAGITFLVYIAAGISTLILAKHPAATDVLSMLTSFSALILGVTLFAITRAVDPDIALIAFAGRLIEAIPRPPFSSSS